jgi:hypothetical protein
MSGISQGQMEKQSFWCYPWIDLLLFEFHGYFPVLVRTIPRPGCRNFSLIQRRMSSWFIPLLEWALLYSLRGPILDFPCPMTMSACFRTHRLGSQLIYLISSFIPHDSWMESTSLGREIYHSYPKGNGIRDYLPIQEGFTTPIRNYPPLSQGRQSLTTPFPTL